ncbi:cysteine peptidase family C39 domain-containing protein [Levilactobacillus brevis]
MPSILQSESSECGLACLAMIASYYGFNVDMLSLRQRFGISTQGATLGTISQIASQIQLKTRALSLDIDEINQLKTPCILHWNMNHFVVLVKVQRAGFVIHDPAFGRRVIGLQEMSNHFTGIALELWPDRAFQKETLKTRLRLLDLMKNIEGLPGTLLKIFALSCAVVGFAPWMDGGWCGCGCIPALSAVARAALAWDRGSEWRFPDPAARRAG